jgi:nucleoside-diphosphate-sugar epimerase
MRVGQVLDWFGLGIAEQARLEVVEGSLEKPDLGLDRERYDALARKADEIIHCAASTSFSERKRPEAEAANVEGARNVLALATRGACAFFHHVSTAYVAGDRSGECAEEFVETTRFLNVYEETKHRTERLALDACRDAGIRLNIYRPSIIHGDSKTGRSLRFNGLYYPLKSLIFLRDLYDRDLRENNGEKARAMGVTRGKNSCLHMPIRIEKSGDGSLNLIPVDHFVQAFAAIMEDCLEGDIFHIVSGRPKGIEDLIEFSGQYFGVEGIRTADPDEFGRKPRSGLESLFGGFISLYLPYMNDRRTFVNGKAAAILQKRSISCPDFDYQTLSRCMSYAVSVDWGKKLLLCQR